MRAFLAGFRSALLVAGAVVWVLAPHSAAGRSPAPEVRVSDVTVSDDGVVTATVATSQAPVDGDPDVEIRVDGQQRDVEAAIVAPGDAAVAVVADTSAAQSREQFHHVTNFVTELALRVPNESAMAVVAAGAPARMVGEPTTDVVERLEAVDDLAMDGERALLDAVAHATQRLAAIDHPHRRIVVVASGPDEVSRTAPAQLAEQLTQADVTLYVVTSGSEASAADPLADLAAGTGGLALAGRDAGDPFRAASAVVDDLANQLQVTFRADGETAQRAILRLTTADGVATEATIDIPRAVRVRDADEQFGGPPAIGDDAAAPVGDAQAPSGSSASAAAALTAAILVCAAILLLFFRVRTTAGPSAVAVADPAARHIQRRPSARTPAADGQHLAVQVHRWVGGEPRHLDRAAAHIETDRRGIAASANAAARRWRIIAAGMTALPVLVGAVRQATDPGFLTRVFASPAESFLLMTALVLTVVGGLWLWVVTTPPFTTLPARRRTDRERFRSWAFVGDWIDRSLLAVVARDDLEDVPTAQLPGAPPDRFDLDDAMKALPKETETATPQQVADARARIYAAWKRTLDASTRDLPVSVIAAFAGTIVPAVILIIVAG